MSASASQRRLLVELAAGAVVVMTVPVVCEGQPAVAVETHVRETPCPNAVLALSGMGVWLSAVTAKAFVSARGCARANRNRSGAAVARPLWTAWSRCLQTWHAGATASSISCTFRGAHRVRTGPVGAARTGASDAPDRHQAAQQPVLPGPRPGDVELEA